jgi:DNA-binding FadR family transcriptional regulator
MTGDPGLAAHCAIAHLDVIGAWLQPRPDRATRHRRVEVDRDDRPERVHIERLGPYKLAEVVAAEIHRDITRRGHPLGEVIGSEHDLLAHYGVSRAVLREAVRILEHHSIALMRPGPGGGLVVDEPDPTAFTDAMVLYLEYEKVGADALGEARAAIELGCIDHVVDSITPDGLVWLRETPTVGDLESIEPGNVAAEDLHLRLAALTQNPILAMFVSSLASIAERRAAQARTSGDARACLAEHAGIVAAIGQRDRSLARNRMLRHLRSLERRRRGSIA